MTIKQLQFFSDKLFKLTKELRAAQKGYFKTRSPYLLGEARRLEAETDRLISQIENFSNQQPNLFTDEHRRTN